jgi:hypothetical protein
LKVFSARAIFPATVEQAAQNFPTTKLTKVSDIDIFKLPNFVFFVSFVVTSVFPSLVAAVPR